MFLDIDGNRVFTLSFGQGPRTILAHGGWISNIEDWITMLAPLSTTWRTITYDHRGAGLTRVPVDRISPQALVDDVFRVMDALDIERCVLAGFSRGTVTAMRAVVAQPERFDGVCRTCASPPWWCTASWMFSTASITCATCSRSSLTASWW